MAQAPATRKAQTDGAQAVEVTDKILTIPNVISFIRLCMIPLFLGLLLLVNWPQVPGLRIAEIAWLPGLGASGVSLGIWLVYAGLAISACTTTHYIRSGLKLMRKTR